MVTVTMEVVGILPTTPADQTVVIDCVCDGLWVLPQRPFYCIFTNMNLSEFNLNKKSGTLTNGLRLVVFERPNTPVYMRVVFLAGARYGEPGLAHFTEHMIISGNERFKTKQEISGYVVENGLYVNAWTNKSIMFLELKAHDNSDFNKLANLVDLFLTKSIFDTKTVETERGAILQEMRQAHTDRNKLFNDISSSLFYQGTRLESPVLGDVDHVSRYTASDLKKYIGSNIVAENTTVVVAGGVTYEEVESIFSKIILPHHQSNEHTSLKLNRLKNIHIEYVEDIKDVKISISFPIAEWGNRRERLALQLLSSILGASQASSLQTRLRQEKGYAYSVHSSVSFLPDNGRFNIVTSIARENLNETLSIVAEEINKIKNGIVNETYLDSRKVFAKKVLHSQLESVSQVVEFNQDYVLYSFDEDLTLVDDVKEMQTITKDEITAVANKYFTDDKWYITLMGKVKEAEVSFSLKQ